MVPVSDGSLLITIVKSLALTAMWVWSWLKSRPAPLRGRAQLFAVVSQPVNTTGSVGNF